MDQVMIPDAGAPGLPWSTAFDTAVENGQLNIVGIILLEGLLVYVRHSRVSSTLSYCRQLSADIKISIPHICLQVQQKYILFFELDAKIRAFSAMEIEKRGWMHYNRHNKPVYLKTAF